MDEENIYQTIGKRIREERQKLGFTLEELADKADIHPSFLGQIERGTKKASIETIKQISKSLDVTAGELFNEEKPEPKHKSLSNYQLKMAQIIKNLSVKDQQLIFETTKKIVKRIRK